MKQNSPCVINEGDGKKSVKKKKRGNQWKQLASLFFKKKKKPPTFYTIDVNSGSAEDVCQTKAEDASKQFQPSAWYEGRSLVDVLDIILD